MLIAIMKNIIITGTNGMIGNLILQKCLQRDDVAKITSITRKPLGIYHPKLVEVIHNDFLDYSRIENDLKNQDICFYCIGVYTGQVSTEDFKKITVAYTDIFANALRRYNEATSFCFLSGQGADSSEKSKVLFAREKGVAENILLKLKFKSIHLFRPGYIYPDMPRVEPNFMYKLMRVLYKPLKFIYPNIGVTSKTLANTMFEVGVNGGKVIFENKDIRLMAAMNDK
jgi:nucleoside-diphosphate-sugar epimerase